MIRALTSAEPLFARDLSQRGIDPVLPAGPAFLEIVEHIAVEPQRNLLFGTGDCRFRRRHLGGVFGRRLGSGFGRGPRIAWSSYSIGSHQRELSSRKMPSASCAGRSEM